jgi:FkbM family methyltransferase
MRILPPRFAVSLFDRFYCKRRDRWLSLYQNAGLSAAPDVSMRLVSGDRVSDLIAFTGVWENDLTRRLLKLARKGGTMIDIGANLGYFSLLWAAGRASNRCIAIEAAPRIVEILLENIRQNSMADRIYVVPRAAAAKPEKLLFDLGPEDQCGWGGIAAVKGQRQIEVEAVRVDEVVEVDKPIALLKVDVEGADAWALMGCDRLLRSRLVEEIWFEQNKPRMKLLGIQANAAQEYLESVGYHSTPHDNVSDPLVQWRAVPCRGSPKFTPGANSGVGVG